MTMRRPGRRPAPKIRPIQVVVAVVVLALFVVGVVVGGVVGALLVGALAVGAGWLLAVRWRQLDERIRVVRLVAVLAAAAVAVSLAVRR